VIGDFKSGPHEVTELFISHDIPDAITCKNNELVILFRPFNIVDFRLCYSNEKEAYKNYNKPFCAPAGLVRRQGLDMQAGEFVDLYVPRKCSESNSIIGAKDHASIQMNVAEVDRVTGWFNGTFKTYAICGAIQKMGESDDSILRLAKADGIVSKNF
ncbi:hypothetical protein A6R68_11385, partial [Neotoma lepida]